MKSIIDFFLVWWLRSGRYRWSRMYRWLCERKYRVINLPTVYSLQDIEQCLRQISYKPDSPFMLFDAISYPQAVWARKKDDCDGFAILASALLQTWSPESKPHLITVMVRPLAKSHTVCAFWQDNKLRFFDNAVLRTDIEPGSDYEAVVNKIAKGAERLICWDVIEPNQLRPIWFTVAHSG